MKFFVSHLPLTFVTATTYLFVVAHSQTPKDQVVVLPQPEEPGFRCYVCVEGVDDNCADPFNKVKNTEYLKPCNEPGDHRPKGHRFNESSLAVGCRKINQEVDDKTHVVRECAYSGEPVQSLKRTGNKGVRLFYNQCKEHGCNSAPPTTMSLAEAKTLLAIIFSIVLAFVIRS